MNLARGFAEWVAIDQFELQRPGRAVLNLRLKGIAIKQRAVLQNAIVDEVTVTVGAGSRKRLSTARV